MLPAAVGRPRQKRQAPLQDRNIGVGGDDVDVIGLDGRAVLHLAGWHPGPLGEQVGQDRFVRRVQVLHEHKCHAGVIRQRPKKLGEGLETAGGGTDSHDGKARRRRQLPREVRPAAA